MAVAIDQHHHFKPFNRSQRCKLQSFTQLDFNIHDVSHKDLAHSLKQVIEVANFHRSFSTPCLSSANVDQEEYSHPRIEIVGGQRAPRVGALVVEVAIAIACGVVPMLVSDGLGGAYFLHNRSGTEIIAVAKPIDEEPLAFNNPKGFGGLMLGQQGIKRSIRVGETGIRELAAYLLDHGGFASVPVTALVKISHVAFHVKEATSISKAPYKIASLQSFVSHDFDAGELGFSSFSVASVHRIGIFDIRILNLDRHAGNILVKKFERHENHAIEAAELVPIDHGLCLPECLDNPYFEWLHWPQASVPFTELEIEYISNLDPYKDAELLRTELPSLSESSIRILILCTIFLKQAANFGLCLADIGAMMTREFRGDEENSSLLETLCAKAKECVLDDALAAYDSKDGNDKIGVDDAIEDLEVFQFDNEIEDILNEDEILPNLLKSPLNSAKPPKPELKNSKASMSGLCTTTILSPLFEETDNEDIENLAKVGDDEIYSSGAANDDENKATRTGRLVKSMSFSVQNYNNESEGISFGDMSEDEWKMFLESFEKLLPEAFESTERMSAKQRLGTSCKF